MAGQSATCKVTVKYSNLTIGANVGSSTSSINLVMGEHASENLVTKITDGKSQAVTNAKIDWKSSNPSVVTVDSAGKITGIKVGNATITATAGGVSDTCEVNVAAAPEFTDFSKAKFEILFDTDAELKISGITPSDLEKSFYYFMITPNNTKPTVSVTKYGSIDTEVMGDKINYMSVNTDEKYIFGRDLDKYVELNQDLYLWVIQDVKLDSDYYNEAKQNISHSAKFVVEGKKLTRPDLPQLNLILKSFFIASYNSESEQGEYTFMRFNFPSATANRKFTIKIGKITNNSILNKIKNNDYSGITELLSYAKTNSAIYTSNLTTTFENYYKSDKILFDGNSLLNNKDYYYIYVQFNDENGKYYPIEGVTLGQAWFSNSSDNWDLIAYTSEKFEWNNLTTTAPTPLPDAGIEKILVIVTAISLVAVVGLKIKNDKYKGI